MFYREAVTWKHLNHPNIVPFFGATLHPLQLVSAWMPGGSLAEYINEHPEKSRFALVRFILLRRFPFSPPC
jgi:serine/threonine protein kinase